MLMLIAVIIGLVIAFLRRGRLRGLAENLKAPWLVILSVLCEYMMSPLTKWFPAIFPDSLWIITIVQYMLLFLFFMINAHLWTISVTALGVLLNFAVIIFNECRMPITNQIYNIPEFADIAEQLAAGKQPGYFIMLDKVPLWFLGDIFYIPVIQAGFASIGDALMTLGVILLIQQCMTSAKPRHMKNSSNEANER